MYFKEDVVVNKFSHIYIEEEIKDSAMTKKITSFFPHASKIIIHDYRDVFNRKKQSHAQQKSSQNLILAKKKNDFLYSASPVCQSFDYANFYYTTTMMNCIYDCEYCFLKGMYPSGNLVIFVNIEDFLNEIENRFLPPSYRMFQPPTTLYDSMIYVSSPTEAISTAFVINTAGAIFIDLIITIFPS